MVERAPALAGVVLVATLAMAPGASAAGGQTSQGELVSGKARKSSVKLSLGWRADCRDGGAPVAGTASVKRLTLRHGRFAVSERGDEKASDGATIHYQATLRGRVRGRAVKGTLRMVISGPYDDGSTFYCDTGPVSFPAAKGGKGRGKATLAITARGKLIHLKLKQPGKRQRPSPPPGPGPGPGTGGGSSGSGSGDGGSNPVQPEPPTEGGAKGKVQYLRYDCAGDTPQTVPLSYAGVEVQRDNGSSGPVVMRAGIDGVFTVPQLSGDGPFRVTVVFESTRIRVVPAGLVLYPYRKYLGVLTVPGQTWTLGAGGPMEVANIFDHLNEAAEVADGISPTPPPQVAAFARWAPDLVGWMGDSPQSQARAGAPWIDVGGTRDGVTRDALEQFVLAHEYGHQVHQYLTGFPPRSGTYHDGYLAFPDDPGLPFTEGLAAYFAALLYGPASYRGSDGKGGCRKDFDLGTKPATGWPRDGSPAIPLPRPDDKQWAQYQEMNIGAAFYRASEALGAGRLRAGAKDLLRSMQAFKNIYGRIPTNPRDVRDALLDFAAAPEAIEQKVGDAFADQGISYGISLEMDPPFLPKDQPCFDHPPNGAREEVCYFHAEVVARVRGPGVQCADDTQNTVEPDPAFSAFNVWPGFLGPLTGRHDDCYISYDLSNPQPEGSSGVASTEGVFWDLPYFEGNAHHGKEWSVDVALRSCNNARTLCPPITIPVRVGTGRWHRPGEPPFLHKPLNERAADAEIASLKTWVTVATFDADGVCTVKTGPKAGAECGVGRKH